jgi:transmembrane sensor
MPNVLQFRLPQRAHEEAAAWIARIDGARSGEDVELLREPLREWLQADARNRKAFLELAAVWDNLDVVSELSALFPLEQPVSKHRRRLTGSLAAAAAAAVLVGAAIFVVQGPALRPAREPSALRAFQADFETAVGGREAETLADGSVVTLNTDTRVEVRYVSASRDVYLLRGEANFEVAHDASHPFNVHVAGRIVQAIGTAFNVRLEPDSGVEVTVTEGKVRVTRALEPPASGEGRSTGGSAAALPPEAFNATVAQGQLAKLARADGHSAPRPSIVRLEPVDLDIKLAWQRGVLIFRGEPLEAMLAEVARYTTARFDIEDDALRDVRVGGYFRAGDVDSLLLALRENFNIESERVGADRIVLRSAQPGPLGH